MLRRKRLVLLSVAVGAATAFAALPGEAETLRTGLARGQVARIVPYVGIPSVGAGVGVAQAEISGRSARASAGAADFGAMSMILDAVASKSPVPAPALPAPITADDREHPDVERSPLGPPAVTPDPPAPPGDTPDPPAPLSGLLPASGPAETSPTTVPAPPAPVWEEAHASKTPASWALVRGPELGVPGVVTWTGGESRAAADGASTSSTVTIGRLVLGGGGAIPEVVLSNLVWTAGQAMGRPGTASFSVGSATVAGQALPIPADAVPADVLPVLNEALAPAGLWLDAPVVSGDAGGAHVTSLVLQVRNPEAVAALLGEATAPAVPVLNGLLDTLLAAAPDASAARLVVNALLATGTTRGGGRLELGGASARIGDTEVADLPAPPPPTAGPAGAPPDFSPPFAAEPSTPPAPAPAFDAAFGSGDPATYPGLSGVSPGGAGPALPLAPTAPSGAARTPVEPAAPDGSTLAARPVLTTAPGGAPAPLVLGAALLAVAVLALGDKLRLRRLAGGGPS